MRWRAVSTSGGRGRATYRPPGTLRGGDRPRPTSGDPPQPGHPTEAKGGPPLGRGIIRRSCARRGDRWGIRGRDAGDDHDQAGRFQAARARPDGQDRRVVRDRPQQAPRRAPGHDAGRLPARLDARGAAHQQRRRHRRAGDRARAARGLLARHPARGAGARGRAGRAAPDQGRLPHRLRERRARRDDAPVHRAGPGPGGQPRRGVRAVVRGGPV